MLSPIRRLRLPLGLLLTLSLLAHFSATVRADGPRDNNPLTVRPIPPAGIELKPEDRSELKQQLKRLSTAIGKLQSSKSEFVKASLPDVLIFERAVAQALEHNEFFRANDVAGARRVLAAGLERAHQLAQEQAPWTTATGLVVRGFVSELDGTVQPYGLVIPHRTGPTTNGPYRCDVWLHGRGETLSEVNFIDQRLRQTGRIAPANTIVLHPYGRYSNAFKFAGEVDVLEGLRHVQAHYPIDANRIAIRGFSMGGAGCWQFAVHYPDMWFAATPGAGFSETPRFLDFFQKETLNPTSFERTLWRWYDCPGYAINLTNCPTIAYSGELDIQKQAADVMEEALRDLDLRLTHLIGPGTKHSIHPQSLADIEQRLADLATAGRDRLPQQVRFATFTLKYNRSFWVTIDGLSDHWTGARVDANWNSDNSVQLKTSGITALTLNMPAGTSPFTDPQRPVQIQIDGQTLIGPRPGSDRSWRFSFHADQSDWKPGARPAAGLRKRHNLQGPVDDAFMSSFLFVTGSGQAAHDQVGAWCESERQRAVEHWRRHFRGQVRQTTDRQLTDSQIAAHNLILWGDPSSNSVLARILPELPLKWTRETIITGLGSHSKSVSAETHAAILIYPNPLNPERYVVLNSGFTFRDYAYLNNARQVPMLPDWALIDLTEPAGTVRPGRIAEAGFFDEQWQWKRSR